VEGSLHFTVLSPENVFLDEKSVKFVRVRLYDDTRLSIYHGHAPLIARLLPGSITYATAKGQAEITISSGILKVSENQVTVYMGHAFEGEDAGSKSQDNEFENLANTLMQKLNAQNTYTHKNNE
jgi:F0F1-type ATP synthase epsilon subunit